MRFDAIVFDFDGVLVESTDVKTRAFGAMYAKYGPEIEQRVIHYHLAHAGISRYVKFKVWQEDYLRVPYQESDGAKLSEEFSTLVVDAIVAAPYVPGAREFLDAYHQELPLFVASGTPEEELLEIVAKRKMSGYFRAVRGTPATKGQILSHIMQSRGYDPARVLMVGDAIADWRGAQEAGAVFIGRTSNEADVLFPQGTELIADLTELAQFIEGAFQ